MIVFKKGEANTCNIDLLNFHYKLSLHSLSAISISFFFFFYLINRPFQRFKIHHTTRNISDPILEKFKGSGNTSRSHSYNMQMLESIWNTFRKLSISSLSCQFHFAWIRRILRTNKSRGRNKMRRDLLS